MSDLSNIIDEVVTEAATVTIRPIHLVMRDIERILPDSNPDKKYDKEKTLGKIEKALYKK